MSAHLAPSVLRRMRKVFFDESIDHLLVYRDPLIGPLSNEKWALAVRTRPTTNTFELWLADRLVEEIAIAPDVEDACRKAIRAYYRELESLCRVPVCPAQAA